LWGPGQNDYGIGDGTTKVSRKPSKSASRPIDQDPGRRHPHHGLQSDGSLWMGDISYTPIAAGPGNRLVPPRRHDTNGPTSAPVISQHALKTDGGLYVWAATPSLMRMNPNGPQKPMPRTISLIKNPEWKKFSDLAVQIEVASIARCSSIPFASPTTAS